MYPAKKFITRKQELFSQITDLIEKDGYANLTVRGICTNLGISTGTFYHYFPEKNDLVWVLFSHIDDYFTNEVALKFVENEPQNLIIYCIEYGNYIIKSGVETCRCVSVAPLKHNENNYLDESRGLFQVLQKILIRGIEKKQFNLTLSPLETARMLMVLLRGYSSDWAKRNGNYNITEVLETFIRLFCKSIV